MSATGRLRISAAAFFFSLSLVLPDARGVAALEGSGASATAGEFVVTLSASCALKSFRLPEFAAVGSFDAGECDAATVALAANDRLLFVATRSGEMLSLTLPEFKVVTRRKLDHTLTVLSAPASGPYVIAVDTKSQRLHVLNRDTLAVLRSAALRDRRGQRLTFARMLESASRRSVLIAFAESELWEMFLAPDAEPVFEGLVHDYRMGEGLREEQLLPIRRIALDGPLESISLEPDSPYLLAARRARDGTALLLRFNLNVRRVVAERRIARMPGALAVAGVAGSTNRLLLATDGEGARSYQLPDILPERDIGLAGDGCHIDATNQAAWVVLSGCDGEATGMVLVVDMLTHSLKSILKPYAAAAAAEVISGRRGDFLWVAGYGVSGTVVQYRSGDWCRASELTVPDLRKAWLYP